MTPRFNYADAAPGVYDAMDPVDQYLDRSSLEAPLLHLVRLRASQLNGCAYCIDMHWKDLRALGETELRLYSLDAWRESPFYTPKERAALEWTEAVTHVSHDHVPGSVHAAVEPHFSRTELADLTFAIAVINAWNRLSIAARLVPGKYRSSLKPAVHSEAALGAT